MTDLVANTPKPDTSVEAVEKFASDAERYGYQINEPYYLRIASTLRQLRKELTEAQEKLDRANNHNIGCPIKGCPHGTVMGVACNYGGSCRGQAVIDAQEK